MQVGLHLAVLALHRLPVLLLAEVPVSRQVQALAHLIHRQLVLVPARHEARVLVLLPRHHQAHPQVLAPLGVLVLLNHVALQDRLV